MSKIQDLIDELCPDGVEYKPLGEIGNFHGGLKGKTKSDFGTSGSRYISYKNIYSNIATKLDVHDFVKVSESENQLLLRKGDVLLTGSSENREEAGLSSVINHDPSEEYYLNSFSICYRFHSPQEQNPDFIKYLFRSRNLRKQIEKTANGVTRINVSKKLLGKVEIPIVPLPVQNEIARILDSFTLLEARRKQYAHYRDSLLNFTEMGGATT